MQPFQCGYRCGVSGILLTLFAACPLVAAAAESASGDQLQEVLVTATRQGEESVQRVPMAISVVSQITSTPRDWEVFRIWNGWCLP
jgi:hypothetical protein